MSRNRTTGAALAALLAIANFVVAVILLPAGSDQLAADGNQPPYAVIVLEIILGVLGLVAAWGAWRGLRWGVMLTLGVNALNILLNLPGIAFGGTAVNVISSIAAVLVAGASTWFLLRRAPRTIPA